LADALRCPLFELGFVRALYPEPSLQATGPRGSTLPFETTIQQQAEAKRRSRAVILAICTSSAVCVVEIGLGWWLGLESLLAEGAHTLLDAVASLIVLVAVYRAAKPADQRHPFGHGKYEALGAAIEGAFILAAALGILYRGLDRLATGQVPEQIPLYVCAVTAATSLLYLFVSIHLMRIARETHSPAVLAEALHLRTHIYITAGIGGGLLIGGLGGWPIADTLLTLGIAICLAVIAIHILREVSRQMLDVALPGDEVERLAEAIGRFSDRFVEVHGLRTRRAGTERHIEMHLVMHPDETVAAAHTLGDEIEEAIRQMWPTTRVMVHIEPVNIEHADHQTWIKGQPKVRTADSSPDDREFIH